MAEETRPRLWVYWKESKVAPGPADCVLTFLSPSAERRLKVQHSGEVLFGREASRSVRKSARAAYLAAAARLAVAVGPNGKTLRQSLASSGQASRWWYHPVSFKDCEADPTFDCIIAVFTILQVAAERIIQDLVLVGGSREFSFALKKSFRVRVIDEQAGGFASSLFRAVGSRLAFGINTARHIWTAHRYPPPPKFDVAFSGFWDWSMGPRYFGQLPRSIQSEANLTTGWLAWMDNQRALPGAQQSRVFLLQGELRFRDLLKALVDLRPLFRLIGLWNNAAFQDAFSARSVSLFPFFRQSLIRGFIDWSIPYGDLVAKATERACRRVRPSATFSFLEHFPYARAHYEGVRRAQVGAVNYTIQHASYCSEKTFLFLDPDFEFRGQPDTCSVPHPDYVFAMGEFPRDLFLSCGYEHGNVIVTGSPRYDGIKSGDLSDTPPPDAGKNVSLLLVGGLAVEPDLEMIDAGCAVAESIPELRLAFRKHPLSKIRQHRVQVTQGSLDDDLRNADIVLFTYSTVAEEAFLRGRPVWQWLPQGFNASAISEVTSIPRFGSIDSLREAILSYRSNPAKYLPDERSRRVVLSRLFFRSDGQAALRIAQSLQVCRRSP